MSTRAERERARDRADCAEISTRAELLYRRGLLLAAQNGHVIWTRDLHRITRGLRRADLLVAELENAGLWMSGGPGGWSVEPGVTRRVSDDDRWRMSDALRLAVLERDGYECKACGACDSLVMDHVVPVVRGGRTEYDNLQALCAPCNGSKHTKPWDEFLAARG